MTYGRSPDALAEQTREALALLGFRSFYHPREVRLKGAPWFDYGWFDDDKGLPFSIWVSCFPHENRMRTLAIAVKLVVRYHAYPDEPPQERIRFDVAPGVTQQVIDAVTNFNEKMRLQQCRHIR